jgi:hypothetical protein
MQHLTPEGYFNATDLLPVDDHGKAKLKTGHFLDNQKTQQLLDKIGKQPITKRGRGACTFLPNEIKNAYLAWLNPESLLS